MKPDTQDRLMTRRLLAAAVLAAGMSLSTAQAAMAPAVENAENLFVGEVSLVLGKAWLLGEDESRTEIASGTRIRATDRILTAANGHVHIRFIDQALVSVRPDSRLEIVRYDYN